MTTFVTLIILGLLWGGVYLLAAEGLNLIYGVMKVVNLAHGDFIVFGGLLAFSLYEFDNISPLLSFPIAAIVLLAIGAAVQFGILERIGLDRGDAELRTLLATFGLSYVVANTSFLLWGSQFQSIPFLQGFVRAGPIAIPQALLVCSLLAFAVAIIVHVWLNHTMPGKSVRAVAQSGLGAASCGLDIVRIRVAGICDRLRDSRRQGQRAAHLADPVSDRIGRRADGASLYADRPWRFGQLRGRVSGGGIARPRRGDGSVLSWYQCRQCRDLYRLHRRLDLPSLWTSGKGGEDMKNGRFAEIAIFLFLFGAGIAIARLGSGYQAQTLFQMAMMTLLAIGWNIISGFTGYVSFGQVAFFGLGAYVAAVSILKFDLPWYAAAAIAAVGSGILALPLGLIMLRLNGIFFALGMFGLARILQLIANSLDVTGGPMGTTVPVADSPQLTATVAVVAAAGGLLLSRFLSRSRLGLTLMATRDDAVAAEAAGVNTWKSKVAAFCISGCIAAVAGSLYVWNVGYLDPNSAFAGTIELQTVLIVLAGGIGTVWGPVVGGILISLLSTFLWARFPMEQQIILGVLIMLIAIVSPGGLLGALFKRGWLQRQPIWGPPPAVFRKSVEDSPTPHAGQSIFLTCNKLGVRFGGVRAVEDVDVEVRSGEMLAIIGPNGAGKSSLFNLMSAFHRPTTGDVKLLGQSIVGPQALSAACARRHCANVSDEPSLFFPDRMGNGPRDRVECLPPSR